MFGPARSPTKAPYRSPVKALALEVSAAPPIPPTVKLLCYHGEVTEATLSLNCGNDTAPDCSGVIKDIFPGELQKRFNAFGCLSSISWKNFPIDVIDPADGSVIVTIDYPCLPEAWPTESNEGDFFIVIGSYANAWTKGFCDVRVPDWGRCWLLTRCDAIDFGGPGFGEKVSFRIQVAKWGIQSIINGEINIGFNALNVGDHVKITGTPTGINDRGLAAVTVDSGDGDLLITDQAPGLQDQGAGGNVELLVAGWDRCDVYTAVSLPSSNFYPAILYTDVGDDFGSETALIRLSGAGSYDGDHPTDRIQVKKAYLVGTNWTTRVTSGAWINNILQLNAPGHSIATGIKAGRIVGTTLYDGEYDFEFVDAGTLWIRDDWFLGSETGTIQYQNVFGTGTGIDPGWSGPINIIISGTTNYDGPWSVNAFNFGAGSFFTGGQFDTAWGYGVESGTWVEDGGLGRSGTIQIEPENGPDEISSFQASHSGSVRLIDSDHSRLTTPVQAIVGGGARLWTNSEADPPPYFAGTEYNITRVSAGWIEIDGFFDETDDGRVSIRDPF